MNQSSGRESQALVREARKARRASAASGGVPASVAAMIRFCAGQMMPHTLRSMMTPKAPPTLLLHGTKDPYVNYEQAVWMRDRLAAADVEVEFQASKPRSHQYPWDRANGATDQSASAEME